MRTQYHHIIITPKSNFYNNLSDIFSARDLNSEVIKYGYFRLKNMRTNGLITGIVVKLCVMTIRIQYLLQHYETTDRVVFNIKLCNASMK